MGNRTGKMSHCGEKQRNTQEARSGDSAQTQFPEEHLQSNTIADENIYVTDRSENSTAVSQQESENATSVSVSTGSISDLSVRGVQHIMRESINNYYVQNSNNPHIDNSTNCYGPVTFVNSSQSNVQIINQQSAPIVHDFGKFLLILTLTENKLRK